MPSLIRRVLGHRDHGSSHPFAWSVPQTRAAGLLGAWAWAEPAPYVAPRERSQNCEGDGLCERASRLFGDGE